jgi:hypothetical protein
VWANECRRSAADASFALSGRGNGAERHRKGAWEMTFFELMFVALTVCSASFSAACYMAQSEAWAFHSQLLLQIALTLALYKVSARILERLFPQFRKQAQR